MRLTGASREAAHGTGRIVLTTEDGGPFSDAQKEQVDVARGGGVENVDGSDTVLNPFSVHAERTDRLQQLEDGREEAWRAEQRLDEAQVRLDTGQDRLDDARRQAERAAGSDDGRAFLAAEHPLDDLEERQAEPDRNQDELDPGRTRPEAGRQQPERGEPLAGMTEKFRTVSADDRAALAVVTFTETQQEVPTGTKDTLQRTVPDADPDGVRADFSLEIAQDLSQPLGPAVVVGVAAATMVPLVMLGTVVAAGPTVITALAALDLTGIHFLGVVGAEGAISVASAVLIAPSGAAAHVPPDREAEPEQTPEQEAAGTPAR